MLKYLKLAQNLDCYGNVTAWPIREKLSADDYLLSVGPRGVSIFVAQANGKYRRQCLFIYDDITRGGFVRKQFELYLRDGADPPVFRFKASISDNKLIARVIESNCRFILYNHNVANMIAPPRKEGFVKYWVKYK